MTSLVLLALEPPLVRLARIEEMNYLIMDLDVCEIVDREFALERMSSLMTSLVLLALEATLGAIG